ncbi:MAG: hypothetical protein JWM80_6178 [Cyanobacteria bacterium RYN_339]|nr:hypothetical protein [Cyanobacteria bacterium RYN_339]
MDWFRKALIATSLVAVSGCTYVTSAQVWHDGRLVFKANFPTAQRHVQVIPEGTQRIEVRVTGEGIPADSVLAATMTPQKTQATFANVPAGAKNVVAKAYDAEGAIVAAGSTDVNIIAGATVLARIRLDLLTDEGNFELVLE